jgi:cobalt-zinc-cadmium efflux system protein
MERGHAHAGHGHAHGHAHGHGSNAARGKLLFAFTLTAAFMLAEAAVGWWTHSLTLLADAGHMLADAGALGLALVAQSFAARPRTAQSTFGYRRAEVLAAFVNGMTLAAVAALIAKEAFERWLTPSAVLAGPVLWTAALGFAVNVLNAYVLTRGAGSNANVRAAISHVLSDAIGSVAAIASALLLMFTAIPHVDPLLATAVALLIAYNGYGVLRETSTVLLESVPGHLDVPSIEQTIKSTPGVVAVHDLHVWQISDDFDALSAHIVIARGRHGTDMCREVAERLKTVHRLEHVTIQPEPEPPDEVVQVRRSQSGGVLALKPAGPGPSHG